MFMHSQKALKTANYATFRAFSLSLLAKFRILPAMLLVKQLIKDSSPRYD